MSRLDDLRRQAVELDTEDPLARWRDEFVIDDPDLAYLDGNSLGMTPRRTIHRMHEVMATEWAEGLISSWEHWLDLPLHVGDELAPIIGAGPGEVVVHDSTSVNLYQLVRAAVDLAPDRHLIGVESGEFPSDRYIVEGVAEQTGRQVRHDLDDPDFPIGDCAVIVRSLVDYRTAEIADLSGFTARAKEHDTRVIWDLSHAVGVLDLNLPSAGVELAVGCTYKFLNGGPGAPAFSYVSRDLIDRIANPVRGWFAQADQFRMDADWLQRDGIGRLMIGTPSILALEAARCGIALTAEAGISSIERKARSLTAFALACVDAAGLTSPTPQDETRRGGHVAVQHPDARELNRRLANDYRVLCDYRDPDIIRIGCSPLTTRHTDVVRVFEALETLGALD